MLSIGSDITKLGFTGTRHGMWPTQLKTFERIIKLNETWGELHHGDCIGADAKAHDTFLSMVPCSVVHIHPPKSETHRAHCESKPLPRFQQSIELHEARNYSDRNRAIVEASEILVAVPQERHMTLRSGTWQTVRIARGMRRPLIIIHPDGSFTMENLTT